MIVMTTEATLTKSALSEKNILSPKFKKWHYSFIYLLLLILTSCQVPEQNIYDYYNSLPELLFYDNDLGNNKYIITKNENIWTSKSLAGGDIIPVVDIKNGYIQINDEGSGGGNIIHQVVLFRKADLTPLIGITKGSFNGFYFDSSTAFYELRGNKWEDVDDVFPKFEIEEFLKPEYVKHYFNKDNIVTPNLTSLIVLPQYGTKIKVELNFNKFDFLVEANQNVFTGDMFSEKEADKLWKIIENISIESFELNFNKTVGIFEIADSTFLTKSGNLETTTNESFILDRIWKLKEVKRLAAYIDSASQHKRNLNLLFNSNVENKPNYVLVRAVEDNGGNLVTHLVFHVHKKNFETYRYNIITDDFTMIDK